MIFEYIASLAAFNAVKFGFTRLGAFLSLKFAGQDSGNAIAVYSAQLPLRAGLFCRSLSTEEEKAVLIKSFLFLYPSNLTGMKKLFYTISIR